METTRIKDTEAQFCMTPPEAWLHYITPIMQELYLAILYIYTYRYRGRKTTVQACPFRPLGLC